ncbi:MAG: hypothetical protein PVI44_12985, partial [Balneolaceae bacterium]
MELFKNPPRKYITVGVFALSFVFSGCINKKDIDRFVDDNQHDGKGLRISVTKPVDRDYDAIKRAGTLRMITRYSSNTYFLQQ